MTPLKPLLSALSRLTTALEQLTPALTQATRELHQVRMREGWALPDDSTFKQPTGPPPPDIDRIEIEAMKADLRRIYRIENTE